MTDTTIINTPFLLSPVNNMWGNTFVFNNLNSSATNFKYISKLYVNGIYKVTEYLPPRPVTGYGNYSGYIPVKTSLSYDLNPNITAVTYATNSIANYYCTYGHSWNPELNLESVYQVVIIPTNTFGFSFSVPHGLQSGDLITIQSQNPYFSGTQSVLTATTYAIRTNKVFNAASPVKSGVITNAIRYNGTSQKYWAYNGTRQYNQPTYDFTNIIFRTQSVNTSSFLTTYPNNTATSSDVKNGKPILENSRETISAFLYPGTYSLNVNYYDLNYSYLGSTSSTFGITSSATMSRIDLPVGTYNLSNSSMGISFSNIGAYTINLSSGSYLWNNATQSKSYVIDRNCYLYNNVRIMFLNKWGAFDYWDFHLDDKKSYRINRNEYTQELSWNYNIGDRERTILSQKAQEEHVVNTNWLSEQQYDWLSELITSPEVYVIDETTGYIYPVILTDTNWEFKTANRNKIFNLTLTYEMSYQLDVINQ